MVEWLVGARQFRVQVRAEVFVFGGQVGPVGEDAFVAEKSSFGDDDAVGGAGVVVVQGHFEVPIIEKRLVVEKGVLVNGDFAEDPRAEAEKRQGGDDRAWAGFVGCLE